MFLLNCYTWLGPPTSGGIAITYRVGQELPGVFMRKFPEPSHLPTHIKWGLASNCDLDAAPQTLNLYTVIHRYRYNLVAITGLHRMAFDLGNAVILVSFNHLGRVGILCPFMARSFC